MAATYRSETGTQLLARLGPKQDLSSLAKELLSNGLQRKNVIEFVGEEGTGKTQVLMDLAATCVLPKVWKHFMIGGLETNIVFIDLDFHFSILRLTTIMESKVVNALSNQTQITQTLNDDIEVLIKGCLERLTYLKCLSSHQFLVSLHLLENLLGKNPSISVVMIDSISAFHWTDKLSGGDSYAAQEANQKKVVQALQQVISTYSLVLFVSKPVLYYKKNREHSTTADQRDQAEPHDHMCRQWQQFVSHQFLFSKFDSLQTDSDGSPVYVRQFKVRNTGLGYSRKCQNKVFSVTEKGVTFI